jgi:hypothetical protein
MDPPAARINKFHAILLSSEACCASAARAVGGRTQCGKLLSRVCFVRALADVSLDREIERRQVTADPDLQGPPLASRHVKACRKQLRQSGNRRFSEVQFAATHAGLVLIEDGLGSLGRPTKID